ncbi:uncharacterized protein LOC121879638 [Homarus americanus]|uniref:Uncharacterized protein n=1 Tax=Homarus americanus TaxID=6706 RepID=A0A8J5JNI1_HOMAM|nr:uncharacterized protein LOC121879638 [Homarus americanus]KAG7157768.1 hypothetical protein Hamer_G021456 [Homarus americanus]
MIAHMTSLTWTLVLALSCTSTPALSRSVDSAATGDVEKVGSSELASLEAQLSSSRIVFPGRVTSRHLHQPGMIASSSRYPSWPIRHYDTELDPLLASESREERRESGVGARRQRHLPLVQARHQMNNPWRQARERGYMPRGRPLSHSSLWYWD